MYAEAILKKGEGRTLKSGGAWVYDNEIDRVEGDYENGDILAVKDFDGFFLGWGFINTRSKITIRVMSRRKEHEITEEFLENIEFQVVGFLRRPEDRMIRRLCFKFHLTQSLMRSVGCFADGLCEQLRIHKVGTGAGH